MILKCAHPEIDKAQDAYKIFYVYLCKDGVGIKKALMHSNKENSFTFPQARKENSGNYSCLYSTNEYDLGYVQSTYENSVNVEVKGKKYSDSFLFNSYFLVNMPSSLKLV